MLTVYKNGGNGLTEIENVEPGCWINIYPPFDRENLEKISSEHDVPVDFLTDSLDLDERSRYEREDDTRLIVLNTPVKNEGITDSEALFITIPIGIIIKEDFVITLSAFENPVIDSILNYKSKKLDPANQADFILRLLDRNVHYFLSDLKELNYRRFEYEKELYNSSRNKELSNLLNIQKSLVYFVTNLRSNELMMMKMQRTNFLMIKDDEQLTDDFEDIIIDNSQALEMSDVYTKVLNGTMDAFASIISNNLGSTVQKLTSVTIVLMVPTLVASWYGMNVNLPFQDNSLAFLLVVLVSIILSVLLVYFFVKWKWF